jgi:hypothetical protein
MHDWEKMDTLITTTLGLSALLWMGELLVAGATIADFYGVKIAKPIAFKEHQRRLVNANTIAVPAISALFAGFIINISSSYIADSASSTANQIIGFGYFLLAMVVLIVPLVVFLRDSTELTEVATDPTTIMWAADSYSVTSDPRATPLGVLRKNLEAWEKQRLRYTFGKRPRRRAVRRTSWALAVLRATALKTAEPNLDESQAPTASPLSESTNSPLPGLRRSISRSAIPVFCVHAKIFPVRTIMAVLPAVLLVASIVIAAPKPHANLRSILFYSIAILVAIVIAPLPPLAYSAMVSATAIRTYVRDSRTLLDAISALWRLEGKVAEGVKTEDLAKSRNSERDALDAALLERLKQLESSLHSQPRDHKSCDWSRDSRTRTLLKDRQEFTKRRRRLSRPTITR